MQVSNAKNNAILCLLLACCSLSAYWAEHSWFDACRLDHLSVCRSVQKVYCGKTADWIRMPFEVVSGVGQGLGVLDGVVIVEGEGAVFGMNLEHNIVTSRAFATCSLNYFEDLI